MPSVADIAHARAAISITAPRALPRAIRPPLEVLANAVRRDADVVRAPRKAPIAPDIRQMRQPRSPRGGGEFGVAAGLAL